MHRSGRLADVSMVAHHPCPLAPPDKTLYTPAKKSLTDSHVCLLVQGLGPLHMAAHQGHAGIVNQLCRLPRVEVDALDNAGCTPLHHATALGHDAVVMELWSKSANVDLADTNGWTGTHTHTWHLHTYAAGALVHSRCNACIRACSHVCSHTCITLTHIHGTHLQSRLQTQVAFRGAASTYNLHQLCCTIVLVTSCKVVLCVGLVMLVPHAIVIHAIDFGSTADIQPCCNTHLVLCTYLEGIRLVLLAICHCRLEIQAMCHCRLLPAPSHKAAACLCFQMHFLWLSMITALIAQRSLHVPQWQVTPVSLVSPP